MKTPGHSVEDFSITGIALLENPPTDPEELKAVGVQRVLANQTPTLWSHMA